MEQAMPFEGAMEKLTKIVAKLESGEGSLDEMIRLYEEGMTLVTACEKQLDGYEATISKLNGAIGAQSDAE